MRDEKKFESFAKLAVSELQKVFDQMNDASVRGLLELIKKHQRIFLIGAGREGLATKSFAMRLVHLGKTSYWIWDDTTPAIGNGDLMICSCGSANVGHINHVVAMAKEAGATIALVTAAGKGPLIDLADQITKLPAEAYRATGDFVKSEQLMGNLFEQSLFVLYDILAMVLRIELGLSKEDMVARHRNVE
jgi:6-phospho-3-hexuloisomerase